MAEATDSATAERRALVISTKAAGVEDDLVQSGGVSLQGSAAMITEFFAFGVNSILFQRGIYDARDFQEVPIFGLIRLECAIPDVRTYLHNVFADMHEWMRKGQLQRVAVVIESAVTKKVLERWRFDVNVDVHPDGDIDVEEAKREPKDEAERKERKMRYANIVKGIRAVVSSISSSVALLPLLEDRCSFEVLLYTKECAEVPDTWAEVGPKLVTNAKDLKLRSFTTSRHKIDAMVQYAAGEEKE